MVCVDITCVCDMSCEVPRTTSRRPLLYTAAAVDAFDIQNNTRAGIPPGNDDREVGICIEVRNPGIGNLLWNKLKPWKYKLILNSLRRSWLKKAFPVLF